VKQSSRLMAKVRVLVLTDWLLLVLFIVCCITDGIVVYHTSLYLLDSDASSELVFAKHLSEAGGIVSLDWHYSTELCILGTQLIFAPLFRLFSVWRHTRFFGTLILQALLLLSYWYVCKTAKLNRKAYLLGGSLLLLPMSVAYGRIILYHVYYISYVIISFLIIALFLALLNDIEQKENKVSFAFHFLLGLILSFASGMCGIRQICITHLPIMMTLIVALLKPTKENDPKPTSFWLVMGLFVTWCLAFFWGYIVNSRLAEAYSFADYSQSMIELKDLSRLSETLFGFFHMFGYRRDVLLVSTVGILSLLGLLAAGVITIYSGSALIGKEHDQTFGTRFLTLLFPCGTIAYVLMLMIVDSISWATLYVNLFFPLFFPMVGALLTNPVPEKPNRYGYPNRILTVFVAIVLLANSAFNVMYFLKPSKYSQNYEGLGWDRVNLVSKLEPLRAQLVDEGYDVGYCTYWFGNVLTEMSNGQLETVPIVFEDDGFQFMPWLTEKEQADLIPQKPFVIIARQNKPAFELTEIYQHCQLVKEQVEFIAYELDDPMIVYDYLHQTTEK